MDKYEYKVRADEIKDLIAQGEYVQAAEIADTIDWRRVKSVMMLCTISDLYKINRRYEDARNMLLLAYERRPGGRTICYSLCELSIKMEDFVPAVNYYKEFVQVAPKDPGRYILQYKLYEAQDVSLEERIGVLEELKKRDYREKWAYELAYLYHRVGLATRCVEECDELILWFGEGKYVIKAMELKMLHQPLTPSQQEKYEHRFDEYGQSYYEPQQESGFQGNLYYEPRQESISPEQPYYAPEAERASSYDVGGKTKVYEAVTDEMLMEQGYPAGQGVQTERDLFISQEIFPEQEFPAEQELILEQELSTDLGQDSMPGQMDEMDIQIKPMDMGQYNTINLQAEIAAGLKEVLEDDQKAARGDEITRAIMAPMLESETESLDLPEIDEVDENDLEPEAEVMEGSEVFFGETGELGNIQSAGQMLSGKDTVREIVPEIGSVRQSVQEQDMYPGTVRATDLEKQTVEVTMYVEDTTGGTAAEASPVAAAEDKPEPEQTLTDTTAETVMEQLKRESRAEDQVLTAQPPKEIARVLSQESDGQISFVVPESEQIEKQITGQMNLDDILVEWERMKQESAERRKEEVRQHVLRHTGEMFTAFEAAVRDGLLEQLESDSAKEQPSVDMSEENIAAEETGQSDLDEETAEKMPADEYPDETEDWDRPTQEETEEEPEEEPEGILSGTEQEVIFGEDDGVEEIEEIYEPAEQEIHSDTAEQPVEQESQPQDTAEQPVEQESQPQDTAEQPVEQEPQPQDTAEQPVEQEPQPQDTAEQPVEQEPQPQDTAEQSVEQKSQSQDAAEQPVERKSQSQETAKPAEQNSEEAGEQSSVEREKSKLRSLTKEEKELYGPYIQSRASREQLVQAIDSISMAAYTGNIIITGEEGMDTVSLAKNMIREVQMTDSNFAGKVAKISGQALNKKDVETTINQLASGALIIQKASGMDGDTVKRLHKTLQQESFGIIIILEDVKKAMTRFLEQHPELAACFTARMDVESLSNGTLVAFGRKYAREREYSIDDMGILALHTKIDEMQTIDHVVTVLEVKEIVDKAIEHANKKNLKHFFDILLARRYDEEDMIVLSERDFV